MFVYNPWPVALLTERVDAHADLSIHCQYLRCNGIQIYLTSCTQWKHNSAYCAEQANGVCLVHCGYPRIQFSHYKNLKFSDKYSDIFHISAQNIDCRYSLKPPHQGSSNKYPQSMFLNRNKKNNIYPCKPQFYYLKVGLRRSTLNMYDDQVDSKDRSDYADAKADPSPLGTGRK